jgi:hypothetical protein
MAMRSGMWEDSRMAAKFIHRLLPGYLSRVLSLTFKDWRPRVWSVLLTISALTIATWLQPPPIGTIVLDWSKWKATVEAWGIVLGALFCLKVLFAQWKVHKEDQAQLEEALRSDLVIHSAEFFSSDGKSKKCVRDRLQQRKRDGLVFVSSSDGLGCDPRPGDEHKYLKLSYSFGDAGPFDVVRPQTPHPLMLPEDQWRLEQISRLRRTIEDTRNAFHGLEQAGELEITAYAANRLHSMFSGFQGQLAKEYPCPLNPQSLKDSPNEQIAVLQALYDEHWQQTSSATSQLSFNSSVRKIKHPMDKKWPEVLDMLRENEEQLKFHAAKLRLEAETRATISAMDHT